MPQPWLGLRRRAVAGRPNALARSPHRDVAAAWNEEVLSHVATTGHTRHNASAQDPVGVLWLGARVLDRPGGCRPRGPGLGPGPTSSHPTPPRLFVDPPAGDPTTLQRASTCKTNTSCNPLLLTALGRFPACSLEREACCARDSRPRFRRPDERLTSFGVCVAPAAVASIGREGGCRWMDSRDLV